MNDAGVLEKFNYLTTYKPSIKYREMYDNKQDLYYTAWMIKVEVNSFEEVFWDRELNKVLDVVIDFIQTHILEN